ncbi:heavy metal-associated isoprenylated plant protein 43-like [Diospyros lotus]|uniref:heavy metal-associated isoprenylated plant protein 43-like n=1 Tax=Diospyros lotus TaxID=55363 RepID=UPI00225657EC|nr:heavy metal-associated isoprenylated plant protein 43-like [Diospyros lotus]
MKKTELKVSIPCQKSRTQVLKAVAKLAGVDQMSVDGQKGTLTVVGEVDPILVAKAVRKTGSVAEIISVGPPKPPEKKPEPEKPLLLLLPPPPPPPYLAEVPVQHYGGPYCSIL